MRQKWPDAPELAREAMAGPARPEPGQCRARCRATRPVAHEIDIDDARRRCALVSLGVRAGRGRRPLVRGLARATNGRRSSSPRPTSARARPPRSSATQGALAGGTAQTPSSTSACANASSGSSTGLTTIGIRAALPGGSRAPPPARQILPPAAGRRELGRRDPAPALDAQHDQPPISATGACWSSATRSWCCASATFSRSWTRSRDPQRSTGSPKILNCGIAAYRIRARRRRRCAFPSSACGTTARRWRPKARPRPRRRTRWRGDRAEAGLIRAESLPLSSRSSSSPIRRTTWITLVDPAVPNGTPAIRTSRSPPLASWWRSAMRLAFSTISSKLDTSRVCTAWTPHSRPMPPRRVQRRAHRQQSAPAGARGRSAARSSPSWCSRPSPSPRSCWRSAAPIRQARRRSSARAGSG